MFIVLLAYHVSRSEKQHEMASYLGLNQQAGRHWVNRRSNESNILSVLYGLQVCFIINILRIYYKTDSIKQTKNRRKYLLTLFEKECFGMLI